MRLVVFLVLAGGFALGCSSQAPPPFVDAGGPIDGGGVDAGDGNGDTDEDGLCDALERTVGTDPLDPDSDADGLIDRVEAIAGFDPLAPLSPSPSRVVFLPQTPDAIVSAVPTVTVFGSGLDYVGAFEALPAEGDLAQLTARDFLLETRALSASPEENVALIEPGTARFLGVSGPADLAYEVRFSFQSNPEQPCARGYPYRYNIKRSDGLIESSQRFLLVVLPQGATVGAVDWCLTDGCISDVP